MTEEGVEYWIRQGDSFNKYESNITPLLVYTSTGYIDVVGAIIISDTVHCIVMNRESIEDLINNIDTNE